MRDRPPLCLNLRRRGSVCVSTPAQTRNAYEMQQELFKHNAT